MSPYVIDQKKRQEYFLFLIFFIVLSFALGYFFGYQVGQKNIAVNTSAVPLLEKTKELKAIPADKTSVEKKNIKTDIKPEKTKKESASKKSNKKTSKIKDSKKTPGKKAKDKSKIKPVSIKKVVPKSDNNLKSTKLTAQSNLKVKKETTSRTIKKKIDKKEVIKSKSENQQSSLFELPPSTSDDEAVEDKTSSLNSLAEKETKTIITGNKTTEESGNKLLKSYSVQVGMFASKPNAEKFVNTLKDSGFDVYLGDFMSASGIEKYNVRLGPYAERKLARENMGLYKKSYSTPAYIIINK